MSEAIENWVMDYAIPGVLWLIGICIVLAILLGIAWCICELGAKKWEAVGIVHARDYEPNTLETRSVPVATGHGVGMGVVTTGHSEEWNTLIEVDGTVYVFNNTTIYAKARPGDKLRVRMKHNSISGTSITDVWPPTR